MSEACSNLSSSSRVFDHALSPVLLAVLWTVHAVCYCSMQKHLSSLATLQSRPPPGLLARRAYALQLADAALELLLIKVDRSSAILCGLRAKHTRQHCCTILSRKATAAELHLLANCARQKIISHHLTLVRFHRRAAPFRLLLRSLQPLRRRRDGPGYP